MKEKEKAPAGAATPIEAEGGNGWKPITQPVASYHTFWMDARKTRADNVREEILLDEDVR